MTWPPAAALTWCASTSSGASRWTPSDWSRRTRIPGSSRRCTQRPPPASAPTSPRSEPPRGTRCCWWTRSPPSAASNCGPMTGALMSAMPGRRSASVWPPVWHRSPSTSGPGSAASRSRSPGTWTLACWVATWARRVARSAPTITPRRWPWWSRSPLRSTASAKRAWKTCGPVTKAPATHCSTACKRWAWSCSRPTGTGCPN